MTTLSDTRATGGKVWNPNANENEPVPVLSRLKRITPERVFITISTVLVLFALYLIFGIISNSFPYDFKENSTSNILTYTIPDKPQLLPGWRDSSLKEAALERNWMRDKTGENASELTNFNKTSNQNGSLPGKSLSAWYDGKDSYYQVEKIIEGQKVTLTLTKVKDLTTLNRAMTS
jgi:hypothetical protein